MNDLFPNSPQEPGAKQPAKGPGEAAEKMYADNEIVELNSPPSIRKYAPCRTEQVKRAMLPAFIANSLRDSYKYGGDYKADFDHWISCLSEAGLDKPFLTRLKNLRGELDSTRSLARHKEILSETKELLLELRAEKRRGE